MHDRACRDQNPIPHHRQLGGSDGGVLEAPRKRRCARFTTRVDPESSALLAHDTRWNTTDVADGVQRMCLPVAPT
jgi:hypothetical protein